MKKTNTGCNYVMFAGENRNDLYPISAWSDKDEAIEAAKRLLDTKVYKLVEVTFMPEYDVDINEIVWTNSRRK